MKKFISLALALVMALSLTTMAWGATETVTTSTMSAQRTIASGEDVVLTADAPVTITVDSACVDAFVIEAGGKLTIGKNVTITGAGALIWVNGGELVIEGKVVSTGATYGTICVSGNTAVVDVEDGAVVHSEGNTAIGIDHLGNTVPSAGAVVNVNGGTVSTDAYSALFGYTGTINVYGGEIYTENATSVALIAAGGACTVNMYGGTVESVLAHEGAGATANIYGGTVTGSVTAANGATVAISGGTFSDDVSEYVVAGKVFVNGEVQNATPAGNTISYNVKDLTVIEPDGTKVDVSAITSVIKIASVTNTTIINGKTTTTFVPAYYQLAAGSSAGTFVECDKSVADYMFTIKNVGSVFVREMAVPAAFDATPVTLYTAPKTATCGMVGANESVYVVANGKYYATDYTVVPGAESYALVNGKMVVYYGEATAKGHNWATATVASYDAKTGAITSVKCADCKGVVAVFAKAGSFDGKTYVKITEGVAANYFYVAGTVATQAPAAGTTGTTSSTVQSAQTFDAGIAMYVGMSVMAAAGSAVVLKKKD